MRLYYEQITGATSNFGDNLNIWLWEKLLPGFFDDDDTTAFVGIGTVLNDELVRKTPNARRHVIFSSGVGYGQKPHVLRPEDDVYCVRGPLSARHLGLEPRAAVTDGALLVRRLVASTGPKRYKFSFMPHISRIADDAWASVCAELGFGYIDPRSPIEHIFQQIDSTQVLLAEAMHGAIVADALRVPWTPVVTSSEILSFKWYDWCASLDLDFEPNRVSTLFNLRQSACDPLALARRLRYQMRRENALHDLWNVARTAKPVLSSDRIIETLTDELEERLDKMRRAYALTGAAA